MNSKRRKGDDCRKSSYFLVHHNGEMRFEITFPFFFSSAKFGGISTTLHYLRFNPSIIAGKATFHRVRDRLALLEDSPKGGFMKT